MFRARRQGHFVFLRFDKLVVNGRTYVLADLDGSIAEEDQTNMAPESINMGDENLLKNEQIDNPTTLDEENQEGTGFHHPFLVKGNKECNNFDKTGRIGVVDSGETKGGTSPRIYGSLSQKVTRSHSKPGKNVGLRVENSGRMKQWLMSGDKDTGRRGDKLGKGNGALSRTGSV